VNRAERTLTPSTVGGLEISHVYPNWVPVLSDTPYQIVVGNLGYAVVTGSGGGARLAAFELPAGTEKWSQRVAPRNSVWNYAPAEANGVIYVGASNAMHAFNAITGRKLWVTTVAGSSPYFNETTVIGSTVYGETYFGGTGAVAVANGVAYVINGSLFAYNASTGAQIFESATAIDSDTAAVSAGVVYVEGPNDLDAFKANSGALEWSSPTMTGDSVSSLTHRSTARQSSWPQ
jgi:outer membrane protein assembly factor BamB